MRIVEIYTYIILTVVTVLTFQTCQQYRVGSFDPVTKNRLASQSGVFLLMVFMTLLIGLRPIPFIVEFGDSANYYHSYRLLLYTYFELDFNAVNLIWDNLFCYFASYDLGITNLFLLGDLLYFGCTYLVCRRLFPHDTFAAYLVFLGAFSTLSYSYNGVKAGIAGAIFLLAMAYYDRKIISIVLVLVSWGFHHSMQLPVAAYLLTLFFKNPKWYFYGWFFCALMAVAHVSFFQVLFAGYTDEGGQGYLNVTGGEDFGGAGGFRADFLLYSAVPVYFGYKFVMKEKREVSDMYLALLHLYLCTNGVWMLCMYASYTNRIAYLSWFLYPVVLVYPFLKEDLYEGQYRTFAKVMLGHLGFTLFMELVFYKFIK